MKNTCVKRIAFAVDVGLDPYGTGAEQMSAAVTSCFHPGRFYSRVEMNVSFFSSCLGLPKVAFYTRVCSLRELNLEALESDGCFPRDPGHIPGCCLTSVTFL